MFSATPAGVQCGESIGRYGGLMNELESDGE